MKYIIRSFFLFFATTSFAQYPNVVKDKSYSGASQAINNKPKKIVAAKPPMGWNSWNNFGSSITETEFKQQVDYVATNLKPHGYEYMVIDIAWYSMNATAEHASPTYHGKISKYDCNVDAYGRWLPAPNKWPNANGSFKYMADYVHSKGLKLGLHIQRGIPWQAVEKNLPIKGTKYFAKDIANGADMCEWYDASYGVDMSKAGAQEYYNSCYELYASWGADFLKVDDISFPYRADEITAVRKAIEKTGRPMVLSLSPGSTPLVARYHVTANADMWRISNDFWDNWKQLKDQFTLAAEWVRYKKNGSWPDIDMLPVGTIGTKCSDNGTGRRSNFTEDELMTMLSFWSIFQSPLMMGGELTTLNDFEKKLLTNDEVLSVNQNSKNVERIERNRLGWGWNPPTQVWTSEVQNSNEKNVAFFNLTDSAEIMEVKFEEIKMTGKVKVRDLWAHKDLGVFEKEFSVKINLHGSGLYRFTVVK
jgi:alpha-galactosidase